MKKTAVLFFICFSLYLYGDVEYDIYLLKIESSWILSVKAEIFDKLDNEHRKIFDYTHTCATNGVDDYLIGGGSNLGSLLYTSDKQIIYLPNWATCINTKRQVIGLDWMWEDGELIQAKDIIDSKKKAFEINRQPVFYFLNDQGLVAGIYYDQKGKQKLFFLEKGQISTLNTFKKGFLVLSVGSMNNKGTVAGTIETKKFRAYLFDRYKGMIDLKTLYGNNSFARGINDSTIVVGKSSSKNNKGYRAFVWDSKHGMRDLNHLISKNTGWETLEEANAINNQGHICGLGKYKGTTQAFLLVPKN